MGRRLFQRAKRAKKKALAAKEALKDALREFNYGI